MSREAMKLALAALEGIHPGNIESSSTLFGALKLRHFEAFREQKGEHHAKV